jgi:hypothetical protein
MINTDKRADYNSSPMKFISLIKEKSFEDMSAIGKTLGLQAVISAGANIPNISPFHPIPDKKNMNLPTICAKDPKLGQIATGALL